MAVARHRRPRREYSGFYLNHYPIYLYYFGQVYERPFAPWHAPFVMAAFTTPVPTLALAGVGAVAASSVGLRRIRRRALASDPLRTEGSLGLFVLLHAAFTIGIVAFSGAPKYGGVKLFLPFFPFLCWLAGYGVEELWRRAALETSRWAKVGLRVAGPGAVLAAFLVLLRYGEHGLSAYGGVAGGLRGATAAGMERQYYDVPFLSMIEWLNTHAPANARVHFEPNHWEYERTFRWYHRAGDLRRDIVAETRQDRAHVVILTHEQRFRGYGSLLKARRDDEVLFTKRIDGVPLWTAFRGPVSWPRE
ncbi:MAG: hypothetical protein HC923_12970 [Myxococcales bacterium]|nr:hypothetical protein [Myxococcales bacterium]